MTTTSKKDSTSDTSSTSCTDGCIQELRPHDVIMGRGLSASEYQGNKRLRQMVQVRRQAYVDAKSREAKQNIAREIVAAIRAQGGRFLRRHVAFWGSDEEGPSSGGTSTQLVWKPLQNVEEMITKVKQLLRDMAPEVKERRVQRRRRQAEWVRQNAYTDLFPDVVHSPFARSSEQDAGDSRLRFLSSTSSSSSLRTSSSVAVSGGATATGTANGTATGTSASYKSEARNTTPVPPTMTLPLNSPTNTTTAAPAKSLVTNSSNSSIGQQPPTTSSDTNAALQDRTKAESSQDALTLSSLSLSPEQSCLSIADVQRLILCQQQLEQERTLSALFGSLSSATTAFSTASSASPLSILTMQQQQPTQPQNNSTTNLQLVNNNNRGATVQTQPTIRDSSLLLGDPFQQHQQSRQLVDPRLILLELERHTAAAPRMLSETSSHCVPSLLQTALDLTLAHTASNANTTLPSAAANSTVPSVQIRSPASAVSSTSTNTLSSALPISISSSATNRDIARMSREDLARLLLLERWQSQISRS